MRDTAALPHLSYKLHTNLSIEIDGKGWLKQLFRTVPQVALEVCIIFETIFALENSTHNEDMFIAISQLKQGLHIEDMMIWARPML